MSGREILRVILDIDSDRFADELTSPHIWFDGLRQSGFTRLQELDAVGNGTVSTHRPLPSTETLEAFLSDYPMFSLFGWVALYRDANPQVFVTGLEFDGRAQNQRVVSEDKIDADAFVTLKTKFFESFKWAMRLELTPEFVLADYCWTPAQLSNAPEDIET